MKILFIGDTHGNWKKLNVILDYLKNDYDIVIQLGDFGFWPNEKNVRKKTYGLGLIKTQGKPFYWIAGNHEHWDYLENDIIKNNYEKPIHVYGDIYHIPRGASFELNGKVFLGFGGALSIDKQERRDGIDWFSQEQPSYLDQKRLFGYEGNVDYFLTHTIPDCCLGEMLDSGKSYIKDCTTSILNEFITQYQPSFMYCGHWHERLSTKCDNTEVEVLSNIDWIDMNKLKTDIYNDDCYKIVEI